jgi:dihydrofolate reductase
MQAILAVADNGEIGFKGGLPWGYNAKDLAHFKEQTLGKTLLCGKTTYNGLPAAVFKGRTVKMVRREDTVDGGIFEGDTSNSFIIGGASLFTLENLDKCETIWLTRVKGTFEADTYLGPDVRITLFMNRENIVVYEDEDIKIIKSLKRYGYE